MVTAAKVELVNNVFKAWRGKVSRQRDIKRKGSRRERMTEHEQQENSATDGEKGVK